MKTAKSNWAEVLDGNRLKVLACGYKWVFAIYPLCDATYIKLNFL
jgi:hypothetical protein